MPIAELVRVGDRSSGEAINRMPAKPTASPSLPWRLSRSPSSIAELGSKLGQGARDGFMTLVVISVLIAVPMAMLVVGWEGRHKTPRHLWIALATSTTLLVSAVISVLAG